jgi:hypothetical protein
MLRRDPTTRATLAEVHNSEWVSAGRATVPPLVPLVGREHLCDDDHDTIVEQMVLGGIAPAEAVSVNALKNHLVFTRRYTQRLSTTTIHI